jgi:hypothetical protein
MKKAKPTARHAKPVKCPVLPIALRLSELWDAHCMAQELEAEHKQDMLTAEQIEKLRLAMEGMASFERARSTSGALFQAAMASYALGLLYDQFGDKTNYRTDEMFNQIRRLLDSVALLLRDKTTREEFQPIERVMQMYLDVDGVIMVRPFKWLDDIPQLAKEFRSNKTANTVEG